MKIYILLILVIIFIYLFLKIMKEGYDAPSLTDTVSKCKNGNKKYIYKNNGLNRWYKQNDIQNIIKNMNNLDFNDNSCSKTIPLKKYHPKKKYFQNGKSNLSNDNIRLMDPCDFYGGVNPITNNKCIENFINQLETEYINNSMNDKKLLSFDDKIYLTVCSAFFVYLLFQVSNKYKL